MEPSGPVACSQKYFWIGRRYKIHQDTLLFAKANLLNHASCLLVRQQPILELVHLEILLEGKNSSGIRLIVSHAISWASPKLYHMLLNHHIKQQCNGKTLEVSSLHGDEVSVCSEKSSNSSASEPRIKRSWGF